MASLEEIAKLRLELEDAAAKDSLADLQRLSKDINTELRAMELAGEKGSDGWKELKLMAADVKAEIKEVTRAVDLNDASMNELTARSRQLQREINGIKVGTEEWIEKTEELQKVNNRIDEVRREMRGLTEQTEESSGFMSRFGANLAAAFTFDAIKGAASAIWDFGVSVFETAGKFEKYEAVLTTALGSQEKAAAAMEQVKEVARTTPFTVDELTESYVKLTNRGMQPTNAELVKMGDLAASQGKSFEQLTEAVLDATTGEFERLKEFGIQASKSGDEVALSFKGLNQTVANTPEAIQGALLAFGAMEGVTGSMVGISQTLEGRLSNVQDNFDNLKVTLGDELRPVFIAVLEVLNWLIEVGVDVIRNFDPVAAVFRSVRQIADQLWDTITSMTAQFGIFSGEGIKVRDVMNFLATAFNITLIPVRLFLTAIQASVDYLNIILNKGKEVANFFGADFKLDPKANFDTLAQNAQRNFATIKNSFDETQKSNVKSADDANKKIEEAKKKSDTKVSEEAKKEAEKRAAAAAKAEADALKKIEDMQVAAIKNETERQLAAERLKYEREKKAVADSLATAATKAKQLEALETQHQANIQKIQDKVRADAEKAEAEYDRKQAEARRKKAEDEKKAREQSLKEEKALFDAQYKAAIANADLNLKLAGDNAQKILLAKQEKLKLEYEYNTKKLEREAEDEKRKNETLITDLERRAAANKAIDDRLKAQLAANDLKYEQDKTKLQESENKRREDNTKQFFGAIEDLTRGNFNSFLTYLQSKVKAETNQLSESAKAQLKHGQDVLAGVGQVLNAMTALNEKYLQNRVAKIESEKNKQLAAWKAQYDAGKISKETYEKGVQKLEADTQEKLKNERVKAFKRDQNLNIAMALVNGAQAAMKAIATMGPLLGLIGVALAAGLTAAQIAIIKRQKPPEFRQGGKYFRNAGVLAGSRHGNRYGDAGIAMIDRSTGIEVGEAEGGEPFMILSRNTYKNNGPVIDRLLHSSLHQNGAPITLANGGVVGVAETDYFSRGMYLFGSKKRKREAAEAQAQADAASRDAEAEARAAQEEAESALSEAGGGSESPVDSGDLATQQAEAQKSIEENNKLMSAIAENTGATVDTLVDFANGLGDALNLSNTELRRVLEGHFNALNDHLKIAFSTMSAERKATSDLLKALLEAGNNTANEQLGEARTQTAVLRAVERWTKATAEKPAATDVKKVEAESNL